MLNFCPFHSTMSNFWVTSQFWMTTNYLDMFKIKSIYMHTTYTPKAQFSSVSHYDEQSRRLFSKSTLNDPNFRPFRSTISCFWIMVQFLEKCTKMTPNDLDMFKVKNTTFLLYTPTTHKFSSVSLYDEPLLSYGPIFGKVHCPSRSKIPTFMLRTPITSTFSSISLHDEQFLSYGQFSEECTEWPQMTLTCSR